jgi:hypothetical protein
MTEMTDQYSQYKQSPKDHNDIINVDVLQKQDSKHLTEPTSPCQERIETAEFAELSSEAVSNQ